LNNFRQNSDIVEIDEERFLIPSVYINGKSVAAPDKKIKLPIEITSSLHILRRTDYKPRPSILERLLMWLKKHN
jgi:hypothetical protein